jgi:hypothetical protein
MKKIERKKSRRQREEGRRETEPGKILVHQPAAPRAFNTIVFVLNGEERTNETEKGEENEHQRKKTES